MWGGRGRVWVCILINVFVIFEENTPSKKPRGDNPIKKKSCIKKTKLVTSTEVIEIQYSILFKVIHQHTAFDNNSLFKTELLL